MPYIKKEDRYGSTLQPSTVGELTFALTIRALEYIETLGTSFQVLSEAVSALECAKLELYRRMVAPYEDKKCAENGDVYE